MHMMKDWYVLLQAAHIMCAAVIDGQHCAENGKTYGDAPPRSERTFIVRFLRGFVQHVATRQSLSLDDPVDAAIDHKLISINRASSLDDCMEIMSATHMRYAVVLGADRAEGIISVADIINELKTNKTYPYRPDKGLCPTAVPGFGLGVGHREQ